MLLTNGGRGQCGKNQQVEFGVAAACSGWRGRGHSIICKILLNFLFTGCTASDFKEQTSIFIQVQSKGFLDKQVCTL